MEPWSRRKFFLTSLASSFAASAGRLFGRALPGGAAVPAAARVFSDLDASEYQLSVRACSS